MVKNEISRPPRYENMTHANVLLRNYYLEGGGFSTFPPLKFSPLYEKNLLTKYGHPPLK